MRLVWPPQLREFSTGSGCLKNGWSEYLIENTNNLEEAEAGHSNR